MNITLLLVDDHNLIDMTLTMQDYSIFYYAGVDLLAEAINKH